MRARILLCGAAFTAAAGLTGPAAANAPSGRYTVGTATVLDTKTNLTWQQAMPGTLYAWPDAKAYCTSAAVSAALGGTGWRLPTIKELATLVDYSQAAAPLIDPTAFPGTPTSGSAAVAWSSTPLAGTTSTAWLLNFANGQLSSDTATDKMSVRCVR